MSPVDVVVIGAGAAGLAAAATLREAGCHVIVIEARARLGGRIWTEHLPGLGAPIELGAEWVHGDAPATRALAQRAGARIVRASGVPLRAQDGRLSLGESFWSNVEVVTSRLDPERAPDRSVGEAIDALAPDETTRTESRRYVEGFHAADLAFASERAVARAEREESGTSRQGRLAAGYGAIVDVLARDAGEGHVRPRTRARVVTWSRGGVTVECEVAGARGGARASMRAGAAIVAVPLGVLKAGELSIRPELPKMRRALDALEPGHVVRVSLLLRRPLGELIGHRDATFLLAGDEALPVWWTTRPLEAPLVVGWRGGPRALALLEQGAARIEWHAKESLRRALGWSAHDRDANVVASWTHDWTHDPLARGAYAYVRTGGDEAACSLASLRVAPIAFAGEHLAGASIGTVEGALVSGLRAARSVIAWLDRAGEPILDNR